MITVNLMSMPSSRRKLFSNAFLSSRMRSHHRHKQQLSATSYFASIKIIQQRQAYHCYRTFLICNLPRSIQELNIQSTTLLAATATSPTRSKKRLKSTINNYPLVVHGPPNFIIPSSKEKNRRQERPFKLVIVESPSKCLTISKILQQYVTENDLDYDFVITSSMGHIRNIPKSKTTKDQKIAGIDLDNNYQPSYTIIEGKESLVRKLQELNASAKQLILATDDDREGEAMSWHLLQLLEGGQDNFINNKNDITIANNKEPPVRVRFTEITRKAIVDAIEHPETSLRYNLVLAQETRRILDRLAGFTVSPILWKKIAPGLSAGRVQSVGMAMTVKRERERLTFQDTEYWSIKSNFSSVVKNMEDNNNEEVDHLLETQLISINGLTITSGTADFNPKQTDELASTAQNKIHLKEQSAAKLINLIQGQVENWIWTIRKVKCSQRKQKPPKPFITSTFQQEANRRLGLSVNGSMRLAQQLYEKGFISYMRTDSAHLSQDAQNAIETEITKEFGGRGKYSPLSSSSSSSSSSSKISSKHTKIEPQAAHEAIRPAIQEDGRFIKPADLPPGFDATTTEVYKLIYQRTVASHMTPQISNQTSIAISGECDDKDATEVMFRTSGSIIVDPGYTVAYPRQVDSKILPSFEEGQSLHCDNAEGLAHMTQPPSRYTEASFVQELEKLGVGRPSTYAGTIQILRDRAYVGSPVTSDSNRRGKPKEVAGPAISAQRAAGGGDFTGSNNARGPLVPSLTAFVVTSLLEKHCKMYVDPTFTAKMEEKLDTIANSENAIGQNERTDYLNKFYQGEEGLAAKIENIEQFVDADVARRADLPSLACNSTNHGEDIGLFIGPWGPYVKKTSITHDDNEEKKSITASLPPGMASDISTITQDSLDALLKIKEQGGLILGHHPEDGRSICLKLGPYGGYLQWGDDGVDGTSTHTLPREFRSIKKSDTENLDKRESDDYLADTIGLSFQKAIQYVGLPRTVCLMGDLPIIASLGPYGPYLKYNNTFMTMKPKDGDVLTIDADIASQLVTERIINQKSKFGAGVLAEIGEKDGNMITVKQGRFGEYINWMKINAKLPRDYLDDPSKLPFEEAWSLIEEKAATKPGKNSRKKKIPNIDIPPAPKRPMSSYFIFCAAKRSDVATKFSSLGGASKELSRLWSKLSDDDKKVYIEMATTAKSAYELKKRKWEEETKHLRKSKRGKVAPKGSSTTHPKRTRSAYIFFCSSNRAEVSKDYGSLGEISKELGRRWKNLDAAAKSKYETMSAEDKLRYTKEKDKLEGSFSVSSNLDAKLSIIAKSKNGLSSPKGNGKKKRSPSAYMLFCASHRSTVLDKNGKIMNLPETTKVLAKMWKECDDQTRNTFFERAEIQKQEFDGVSIIMA